MFDYQHARSAMVDAERSSTVGAGSRIQTSGPGDNIGTGIASSGSGVLRQGPEVARPESRGQACLHRDMD